MLNNKRITAPDIVKKKGNEKIVMLTAYDYIMANLMDPFVDIILVGDSLGCVVRGEDTTLGVTLIYAIGAAAGGQAADAVND